jgi:hypothetical protein
MMKLSLMIGLTSVLGLATLSGCGRRGEEKRVVAGIDAPIKVQWIHHVIYGHPADPWALIPDSQESAYLEIHSAKVFIHTVGCWSPSPRLSADEARSLVAYRCAEGSPWKLLHVGAKRVLRDPAADLGAGEQPDWSRAPAFEDSILNALRVNGDCDHEGVFAEVLELGGAPAVGKLLLSSADFELCGKQGTRMAAWDAQLATLPTGERELLRAKLVERLQRPEVSHWFLRRAAVHADLDHDEVRGFVAQQLVRRIGALEKAGPGASSDEHDAELESVSIALRRLAARDRAAAGELACRALKLRGWSKRTLAPLIDMLAVSTYAGGACTGVSEVLATRYLGCWASQARCPPSGDLGACTSESLAPFVTDVVEAAALHRGTEYTHDSTHDREVMLAAALAQGEIPEWIRVAAARSSYTVLQPDSGRETGVNSCNTPGVKSGERCQCFWSYSSISMESSLEQTVCKLDPGPPGDPEHEHCKIEVNDGAKQIIVLGRR